MRKKFMKRALAAVVASACALSTSVVSQFTFAVDSTVKYEFEDGTHTDSVIPESGSERYVAGASGDEFVFIENGGEIASVTVPVDTTGMYNVILCYSAPYGSKIHNLLINGVDQGQISCAAEDWTEVNLGSVKLNEGDNEIAIKSSWGWTNLDYIRIEEATIPKLEGFTTTLSDPKAIPEAQSLMAYLGSVYGNNILSGQQEIYMYGPHGVETEFEYIHDLTGEYPAIRAFDYLNEANILYGSEDGTTDRMIDWVENKGGIITASWHITVPKNFSDFTLGETKVDWSQATYAPKDTDFDTAKILEEGTKERKYWMACLEDLAASIQKLEDRNIPLIFRPLHEAEGGGGETGSWFFWGKSGSAVYKELWKLTYDTLVNEYDLHNIIWEWNSYNYDTSTDWYPGDEYVDLIAYDKYNCTDWSTGSPVLVHNDSAISSTFYGIVEKYNGKKMVAMSENDSIPTLENILAEKAGWLYFCPWYDGGSDDINFLSNPIFNTKEDLTTMYQSDYCITLDELPATLYSTEVKPTEPTEPTEPTDPTEPTTESPITFDKIPAEISGEDGNYTFELPTGAVIGDALYVDLKATSDVTYANGCVGVSATYDGVDYWVAYQWEISKSGTVKVDTSEPFQISYNEGADMVEDEALAAEINAVAKKQTSGMVQMWWTNDGAGEQIDNSNVTLTGVSVDGGILVDPTEPTDPTEPETDPTEPTSEPSTDPTEPSTEPDTDPTEPDTNEPVTDEPTSGNEITVPDDVEATLYGDVNGDGAVDVADVVALNTMLLGSGEFTPAQIANSDCAKDGIVNSTDSTLLMNFVAMIISGDKLGVEEDIQMTTNPNP